MTPLRLCLCAAALLAAVSLTGCKHVRTPAMAFTDDGDYLPRDEGKGLVASANPLIPDVPMPIGFKAVPSQSTSSFDGRVRYVRHVYQGHAQQGEVANFYREKLPLDNWVFVDMQSVGDVTIMRYTKGPEQMSLTSDHGWGVTKLIIDIKGQ